jgi:hypothetical protein
MYDPPCAASGKPLEEIRPVCEAEVLATVDIRTRPSS